MTGFDIKKQVGVCHIVPTAYLEHTLPLTWGCLILGHKFLEDEKYAEFARGLRERPRKPFVILDNGAYENGRSIEPQKLLRVALDLRPDEVVCPDVLGSGGSTLEATQMFLSRVGEQLQAEGIGLMAVPQGKTLAEWLECFNAFVASPLVSTIGLSFVTVASCLTEELGVRSIGAARLALISAISERLQQAHK